MVSGGPELKHLCANKFMRLASRETFKIYLGEEKKNNQVKEEDLFF